VAKLRILIFQTGLEGFTGNPYSVCEYPRQGKFQLFCPISNEFARFKIFFKMSAYLHPYSETKAISNLNSLPLTETCIRAKNSNSGQRKYLKFYGAKRSEMGQNRSK